MAVRLTVFLVVFVGTACKEVTVPIGTPPIFPGANTHFVDFGLFNDTLPDLIPSAPASDTAWRKAAELVEFWNPAITQTIAVPIAALSEATKHTAVYVDSLWQINFEFSVDGRSHSARIDAWIDPYGISWEVFLSKVNEYDQFHWVSGHSSFDGLNGRWSFFKDPPLYVRFLDMTWSADSTGNVTWIRTVHLEPGAESYGNMLDYGPSESSSYDFYLYIVWEDYDPVTHIEWDSLTRAGRVKHGSSFDTDGWMCWDSNREDVDCP